MLKAQGGDFVKELQVETVIVADTPEESASIKQKMKYSISAVVIPS